MTTVRSIWRQVSPSGSRQARLAATAPLDAAALSLLRDALFAVATEPTLAEARKRLLLERFAEAEPGDYGILRERALKMSPE